MDTNLKKSKSIRAFIYKLITVASFFTMVATSLLGREAFLNLYKEGPGTLTGNIYYLTEFREYVSELYTLGMLGYAGAGDDNGYPLTGESAKAVSEEARSAFIEGLQKGGDDILYHVKQFNLTMTRANFTYPLFSEYDGHLILPDHVSLCCYWDGKEQKLHFFTDDRFLNLKGPENYYVHQYKPNMENVHAVQLLIALKDTDTYTSEYIIKLDRIAADYQTILIIVFASAVLFVFFGLMSLFTRKAYRPALQGCTDFTGNIWLECKILLMGILLFFTYQANLLFFNGSLSARLYRIHYLWLYIPLSVVLYIFLQDLNHNRNRLFKKSFVYCLFREIREYFQKQPWQRKATAMYFVYFISGIMMLLSGAVLWYVLQYRTIYFIRRIPARFLLAFAGILILLGILMVLFSVRLKHFVADTAALADKLTDISKGTLKTKLAISSHSLLTQAAADLNDVEHGIETAIEQNMRANKMRVELITNVSHDLKTPLTSIMNYADLLCEEPLPKPADEYALALRTKAYRLKGMVQDVFDLSKATSGNMPMKKTRLDFAKLVRQTLADMDERIQQSSLTFKLNIITEPLMIEADGDKLYRVFQNLVINALQYSLEHSRVYVQLDKQGTNAVAWIKNTSRQELNFDPNEIMERFVRADSARTTEGSGLGLSIAQSFTEACGGSFSIELNADLFTACISFPLDSEEPSQFSMNPMKEKNELCEEEN